MGVTPRVAVKLRAAFKVALTRATTEPACRALFSALGADARERLGDSLYYGATPQQEATCCRYAFAATQVGSGVTWVCASFTDTSTEYGAVVLIHEALHFAGLQERPPTEGARSPREIDALIRARCGL